MNYESENWGALYVGQWLPKHLKHVAMKKIYKLLPLTKDPAGRPGAWAHH